MQTVVALVTKNVSAVSFFYSLVSAFRQSVSFNIEAVVNEMQSSVRCRWAVEAVLCMRRDVANRQIAAVFPLLAFFKTLSRFIPFSFYLPCHHTQCMLTRQLQPCIQSYSMWYLMSTVQPWLSVTLPTYTTKLPNICVNINQALLILQRCQPKLKLIANLVNKLACFGYSSSCALLTDLVQ